MRGGEIASNVFIPAAMGHHRRQRSSRELGQAFGFEHDSFGGDAVTKAQGPVRLQKGGRVCDFCVATKLSVESWKALCTT